MTTGDDKQPESWVVPSPTTDAPIIDPGAAVRPDYRIVDVTPADVAETGTRFVAAVKGGRELSTEDRIQMQLYLRRKMEQIEAEDDGKDG